jgi:hypothetical protein
MSIAQVDIENLARFVEDTRKSAIEMLKVAETSADLSSWARAIEVSIKLQEHIGKEIVRSRARLALAEAANVLSGAYKGHEDVELGQWAEGCDEETIHSRAEAVLATNKGMY